MNISLDNIEAVNFNGVACDVVVFNGVKVWESFDPHTTLLLKSVDGAVVDKSQNGYAIINNGATVNEQGFTLGATSGWLDITHDCFNNTGDFTIEWIEYSLGAAVQTTGFFCAGHSMSRSFGGLLIGYNVSKVYAGTKYKIWNIISGWDVKPKELHVNNLYSFQRRGKVFSLYKNGVQIATIAPNNGDSVLYKTADTNVAIGFYNGLAGYNAHIKEFKISNIARYTADFTPDLETIFKR